MKGQYFLLSSFFLILLFYAGIAIYFSPSSLISASGDLAHLFENIEKEYPKAFNLGMQASAPAATLVNFTALAQSLATRRGAAFRALWVITENVSDALNVTVGNWLGQNITITLNVSGDVKLLSVSEGSVNSTLFSAPPSEFTLALSFNTSQKNLLLEKYKANLYLLLEIERGDDKIAGEIKA
jgi:hypothetical protein